MLRRVVDVTLENLKEAPLEVVSAVFWELDLDEPPVEAGFEKENWFSSTLLEWGNCGKMALDEEEKSVGFAQYAPPSFFPRLSEYRCGRTSGDAIYLSYCYVVARRRGSGLGTELIRAVARDLVDRGFRALEAIGDREWEMSWVLPDRFLAANGFQVLRDDPRFPLMRLDLRTAAEPETAAQAAAVPLPAPGAA